MALDYTARAAAAETTKESTLDHAEDVITGAMQNVPYLAGFAWGVDAAYDTVKDYLPKPGSDYTDVFNAPADLAAEVHGIQETAVDGLKWLVIGMIAAMFGYVVL